MKKIIKLSFSMLLFCMMFSTTASASEATQSISGHANISVDYFEESGITVVSQPIATPPNYNVDIVPVPETFGHTEKESIQTYSQNIFDRNGIFIGSYNIKLTGWYSEVDQWSTMTGAEIYSTSGEATYNVRKNGNTAFVDVYYYSGTPLATISYTIHTNGAIRKN